MAAGLDGALHQALADDGQLAGSGRHHHIVAVQHIGQLGQGDGITAKLLGQLLATLQRTVGNGDTGRLACGKVGGHQFDHLARADEQDVQFTDGGENLFGQLYRRGGHGYRAGTHRRAAAHFLGHGKGALEQAVEQGAQRADIFGGAYGVLQLTEDLGFPQHHGIQARGHTEGMAGGAAGIQLVQIGA